MDGVENQPSSSSSSRQGRKTPLASNTQSLNIKNKVKDSKQTTSSSSTVSSKANNERKAATADKRVSNEFSSSSEKVVKKQPALRSAKIHTAPALPSNNTDDTDNDITTDSDMAHTEDDKVVVSSSVLTGLLAQLAGKQTEGRSRRSHPRPASAREHRQSSRDHDRAASKDRLQVKDRQRSRDRLRSRDQSGVRETSVEVPVLTLINQDRQEPDGRSSRQGKSEEKTSSTSKASKSTAAEAAPAKLTTEREGRRSGNSLDRGNNTGSSEPPTVIEVSVHIVISCHIDRVCCFSHTTHKPTSCVCGEVQTCSPLIYT